MPNADLDGASARAFHKLFHGNDDTSRALD